MLGRTGAVVVIWIAALILRPAAVPAEPLRPGSWEGEVRLGQWPSFTTLTISPPGEKPPGKIRLYGRTSDFTSLNLDDGRFTATAPARDNSTIEIAGELRNGLLSGVITYRGQSAPFAFRPIPHYPPPRDRLEAWRQDIDTLRTRFIAADRSFSADERSSFLTALDGIEADLPRLDDSQIAIRMAAAIALSDNAHTRLYLLRNRTRLNRLPIRLWRFGDDLHVVRATAAHRDLLGCRIESIDGMAIRDARERVAPLFAGNASWRTYKSAYSLSSPDALHGAGVSARADSIELGVADCRAAGRHSLRALPKVTSDEPVEAWWDLSPRFPAPAGQWAHVLNDATSTLPLYLRNGDNYWFEHLPERNALYVQYNRSEDMPRESTAAFGERLLDELDRRKPEIFILDLRFNTGGNLELSTELMDRLIEQTRGLKRYVITGRATFSAGITAALPWREAGDVVFVGEPVGDALDFWAEGGNIRLPNSGYDAHFANGFHSYSSAPCPPDAACLDRSIESLAPHLPVNASWTDYVTLRDPAMDAIFRSENEEVH